MAYTKTNWVNGYTPLNASNMNKIEEGIYKNDTFLSSLDIRVNTLEGSIGQGGIGSVVVNGNGNALNNVSYNPSTKILNFEKNDTFALDSDLDSVNDKNLYHLGAYDSVSGNVITRQTGYLIFDVNDTTKWQKETFTSIVRYKSNQTISDNVISNLGEPRDVGDIIPTSNGWFVINGVIYVYSKNNDFSNIVNVVFQYKLATPYTEEIIENHPLNTLDQSGSQWLREEWEKGLNLCESSHQGFIRSEDGSIGTSNNSYVSNKIRVYANKTYTYYGYSYGTYALDGTWQSLAVYRSSDQIETFTPTADCFVVLQSKSVNIMLVSGSHFYPYQEYKGQIVREKELNEKIVKVKEFNAESSTLNNFKDWVESNREHIISIMFYNIASGSNSVHNVIFGTDGDVYKYINSEGTFDDVSFGTSGEGEDILKIYYI